MSDPFDWSISLGRWGGTRVRAHLMLVAYLILGLLDAALAGRSVTQTAAWMLVLLVVLALHEIGHASAAAWVDVDQDEVRLWPLGNLAGPSYAMAARSPESLWVALGGPAISLAFAVVTAIGLSFVPAQMVFNPFGHAEGGGAPLIAGKPAPPLTVVWWVGWFGYLNWVMFLANLIPAPPLDGGRVLRGLLARKDKDSGYGLYTAHVCAFVLGLAGLVRLFSPNKASGWALIGLAILIELMVRAEARMLDEGGFFDDNLFGYDFSQGYTSLEAGAPTVRPRRESALKRWRRRRSELRRQRREAQEAAEEGRMDEILAKLHRDGRASLTDDEQRFLVRVSAKYRNRTKPL